MRTRTASLIVLFATVCSIATVSGQTGRDLSPSPNVTAENEEWYLSGSPIALGGAVYHPSGPVSHFVRNEMVPAGAFERVQIYRKTTQEPGSLVYVPLAGGLVRPYERRRAGDLAGTVGSTVPAFPVTLPAEEALTSTSGPPAFTTPAVPRAVGTSGFAYGALDRALGVRTATLATPSDLGPEDEDTEPAPVGTFARGSAPPVALLPPSRPSSGRLETLKRPVGLNNIFIDFQNTRWFAEGPAVEFSSGRFTRIGEHHGFPVYQRAGQSEVIFLAPVAGTPDLLIPYKAR